MLVWSIGEVLWDVFPDQERFGGAPLNFCANLQRLGDRATLLSAVGDDERGRLALARMRALGLDTARVYVTREVPTGIATIGTAANGEPEFVIPRPAAFDLVPTDPQILYEAKSEGVDWLYFGTLVQTDQRLEAFTTSLAKGLRPARSFYDMNLRTGQWTLALVERLSHLASILKLNDFEAETLFRLTQPERRDFNLEDFCALWATQYGIDVICVTLGPAGCLVYEGKNGEGKTGSENGICTRVPGYKVKVRDTVGSGDAFAAAFLHGFHRGWPAGRSASFANALGALVASRPGATPDWTSDEVLALMESSTT